MNILTKSSLLICCAFITKVAFSHDGATGVVKKRMDAMGNMGDATKLVADMYKGKIDIDKMAIGSAIETYLQHGDEMRTLFPDTQHSRSGSGTEALPKIWNKPREFDSQIDAFVEATQSLKAAFETDASDKQLKKQFLLTAKTCYRCHKQFRKPKN